MKRNANKAATRLLVLVSAWLLSGCAAPSPARVSSSIPPLPAQARQPPTPPECVPSCSTKLIADYERLRQSLTSAGPPEQPASSPTTPWPAEP